MAQSKRVLVIGLGRFGTSIVEALWEAGAEVVAVDKQSESVDAIKDHTSAAYVGDASEPRVLAAVGARDVDVAVVTSGEDFEASVLCVASLVALGVRDIVVRAATTRQAEVLRVVGATRVVLLEDEMGRRVAGDIIAPAAGDLLDFARGYRVLPWRAQAPLVGHSLANADLRRRYEINVLGFWKPGAAPPGQRPRLEMPGPDYVIARDDTLLLVGQEENVARFLADMGG